MSYRIVLTAIFVCASVSAAQTAPPPNRTSYAYARDSAFAIPVNRAHIAFTIPEKDLLAESVAFDRRDSSFYVGSTTHGKVVKRSRDGRVSDFIPTGRDGLWMVVGMKVDPRRNALWVNTSAQDNYIRLKPEETGRAGLFRYDLSGRLVKRYFPSDAGPHFFNDVVVAPDGALFITDMEPGTIYTIAGGDSLALWFGPGKLTDPNGITISDDGKRLFVASREGISVIDVATRAMAVLQASDSIDVRGIDGLYWHGGSLIGVQGGRRNRVQRFTLDASGRSISASEVLEANHPMFMNPTTGVIAGDDLYFVANSQFSSFTADGKLFPEERLFETVILRLPLRSSGGSRD